MSKIQQLREFYPDYTKDLSDADIVQAIAQQEGKTLRDTAVELGLNPDERTWKEAATDVFAKTMGGVVGGPALISAAVDPSGSADLDQLDRLKQSALSLKSRVAQEDFDRALDELGFSGQVGAALDFVGSDPAGFVGEQLGYFLPSGVAIKGAQAVATPVVNKLARKEAKDLIRGGLTKKGALEQAEKTAKKRLDNVGLAAGGVVGGAMSGGDAASETYDRVYKLTGSHEEAMKASRKAQIMPSIVGFGTSLIGAERVLAKRTGSSKILGTGLIEGGSELVDETTTGGSANAAVMPYDPSVSVTDGLAGRSALGFLGGATVGGGVALVDNFATPVQRDYDKAINGDRSADLVDSGSNTGATDIQSKAAELAARQAEYEAQRKQQKEAEKLAAANQQANAQQAQANQQQAQANQQQQQVQTAEQLYANFGFRPVLDPETDAPTGQFVVGGKKFYTEGDAVNFAKQMAEAGKDIPPAAQMAIGKILDAGIVPVKNDATAKSLVNAAKKFMDNNGLTSVADETDLATRIEDIIQRTAPNVDLASPKMSRDATLVTNLDKLYKAITGVESPSLAAEADRQMMALKQKSSDSAQSNAPAKTAAKKKVSEAEAKSGPVTIIKGEDLANQSTGGSDGQQQQNTTGLGSVSVQGTTAGTDAGQSGPNGPTGVQSEQSGSVAQGQNGQQNDTRGSTTDGQRAAVTTNTNVAGDGVGQTNATQEVNSGVSNTQTGAADVAGQQTQAGRADGQGQSAGAVGEGQPAGATSTQQSALDGNDATGRSTEATPAGQQGQQETVGEAATLLRKVLEYVFITKGGNKGKSTAQDKVDYFEQYMGVPAALREETATKFAKERGLNVSTVKGWAKDLVTKDDGTSVFAQKYGKRMREALELQAKERGMTFDQVVAELRASALSKLLIDATEKSQEFESGQEGMAGGVLRELSEQADSASADQQVNQMMSLEDDGTVEGDRGASGITISNSPNATSLAEQGNFAEGISNKYIKLSEALEAANESGDQAAIDAAQANLDAFMREMPQLEAKARRAADNILKGLDKDQDVDIDALIEQAVDQALEGESKSTKKKTSGKTKQAKKQTPAKTESQAPAKPENTMEGAGKAWDAVASTMDGAPLWADLTADQQKTFFEFGPENWSADDVTTELAKIQRTQLSSGARRKPKNAYRASDLRQEITDFIGEINTDQIKIYQSAKEIPAHIVKSNPEVKTAQGFVYGNRAYLIADNIKVGRGKAVFLHEVGSHLGLQRMLKGEFDALVDQIYAWADEANDSLEARVARRARDRVRAADVGVEQLETELVAYFIEEAVLAGVKPSAASKLGRALQKILDAFKRALNLLGLDPQFLSVQDVVDMAYGAAKLNIDGEMDGAEDTNQSVQLSKAQTGKINRNIVKLPKKSQPYFSAVSKAMARGLNKIQFTGQLLEKAAKYMPAARNYLRLVREQVAIRNKKLGAVEKISQQFQKLTSGEQKKVQSLMMDSTRSDKWAFDPTWLKGLDAYKDVKMDAGLQSRYDNLSEAAKKLVRDVFAHGYVTMMEMRQGAYAQVKTLYDDQIAAAKKAGNAKQVEKLEADRQTDLKDFDRLFKIAGNKPYAPLRRFGKHVVVFRSGELMDAMDVVENADQVTEEQLDAARKTIKRLESDPNSYQVHFRESAVEAESLARSLGKKTNGMVSQFTRDQAADNLYTSPDINGVLYRLRRKADDVAANSDNAQAAYALNQILTDLHLNLLAEQNARHAEHRRAEGGVEGADQNMMRSFHQHGLATSSIIASLHKSKDVYKALGEMEKQAAKRLGNDRETATSLYNEIAARHAMGLDVQVSGLTDKALRYNSAFMLLSKPLYYLQNAMQPWMMTLPVLMGRYGSKAAVEMVRTYQDVGKVMTGQRLTEDTIAALPKDIQGVIKELLDQGRLNISLDQEMGERLRGTNAVDAVITKLQGMAERVEGINRVVSAAAAYRLAMADGKSDRASAVKYAGDVVYDTHGDYSGFNAPRIMRTQIGRILTQFRKFQLIQISLMAKLGREAFSGASAAERSVARKALGYTLTTAFMMGGLTALPGFAAVAWVLGKIFGEDDEPNDQEAQIARLRQSLGDPDLADFVVEGLPKLVGDFDGEPIFGGWGNMLSLLPYTKIESADRSTYQNILMGLSGALIGGMGERIFSGSGKIAEGDIKGGLAKMLPSGAANVVKAMELADKGITRGTGTEIVSPDDVEVFTVMLQALGLRSGELTDQQFVNRVTTTYEAYYRDESRKVKADYQKAFDKGDRAGIKAARERWTQLNASRVRNGFKPQSYADLIRTPLSSMKYERRIKTQLGTTGKNLANVR